MGTIIGANGGSGGGFAANAVKYVAQSLTDAQKAQARTNIAALAKATPTAEQGTKEYLYSFAGQTQNTDIAVINDMTGEPENYTDKMVPTAKSVATAFQTHLADYRNSSAQDSIDEDDNDVVAAALLELDARLKAIEQRLSPDGNLGKVNVDELSVIKTFNNYTV